jgi:hypothetical protein
MFMGHAPRYAELRGADFRNRKQLSPQVLHAAFSPAIPALEGPISESGDFPTILPLAA